MKEFEYHDSKCLFIFVRLLSNAKFCIASVYQAFNIIYVIILNILIDFF